MPAITIAAVIWISTAWKSWKSNHGSRIFKDIDRQTDHHGSPASPVEQFTVGLQHRAGVIGQEKLSEMAHDRPFSPKSF
jgi:hypothetical protein